MQFGMLTQLERMTQFELLTQLQIVIDSMFTKLEKAIREMWT